MSKIRYGIQLIIVLILFLVFISTCALAQSHEDGLDKIVHMVIQQNEELSRCLKASETLTDLTEYRSLVRSRGRAGKTFL